MAMTPKMVLCSLGDVAVIWVNFKQNMGIYIFNIQVNIALE